MSFLLNGGTVVFKGEAKYTKRNIDNCRCKILEQLSNLNNILNI